MLIYKIFRAPEWAELCENGSTAGAPIDLQDGYIHISTSTQVAETVSKYFAGVDGLVIVALDAEALQDDLRWEPSRGGDLFPHLYREMTLQDVVWQTDLPLNSDGTHEFPDGVLAE